MEQVETIAPSVMIDGQTITPPGWMWILGFAIGDCQWAIDELEKPEIKAQMEAWIQSRRDAQLEEEIAYLEARLARAKSRRDNPQ